jgi:hypothetical protein
LILFDYSFICTITKQILQFNVFFCEFFDYDIFSKCVQYFTHVIVSVLKWIHQSLRTLSSYQYIHDVYNNLCFVVFFLLCEYGIVWTSVNICRIRTPYLVRVVLWYLYIPIHSRKTKERISLSLNSFRYLWNARTKPWYLFSLSSNLVVGSRVSVCIGVFCFEIHF